MLTLSLSFGTHGTLFSPPRVRLTLYPRLITSRFFDLK